MNAPSIDISDIFESSSVGLGTYGTDIFIGQEPETPHACVTIYDLPGEETEGKDGEEVYKARVQIRSRGIPGDYTGAYSKAKDAHDALHNLANETWSGARYIGIWCIEPGLLKYDDKKRPIVVFTCRIQRAAAY